MRRWTGAGIALIAGCSIAFAGAAGAAKKQRGEFMTLPDGTAAGLTLSGKADLKRTKHGTMVKIHVRGLKPGTTYAAHLHNDTCSAVSPGGTHYKNDQAGASTPPNELWLSSTHDPTAGITSNANGNAHGRGSADWVARFDARSVVIHSIPSGGTTAGGPKIACADFSQGGPPESS